MSLRLWLIVFGIFIFMLISLDAWRKNKKKNQFFDDYDEDKERKKRELERELPYGSSRKSGQFSSSFNLEDEEIFEDDPIPLLKNPIEPITVSDPAEKKATVRGDFEKELYREKESLDSEFSQNNDLDFLINSNTDGNKDHNFESTNHKSPSFKSNPKNKQQAPVDILEPRLDFDQNSEIEEDENFTRKFDLEESEETNQEQEIAEKAFELSVTKGLVELEKDLWKKSEESIHIKIVAEQGSFYDLHQFWQFCQDADLRLSERGFVHRFLEQESRNYIQFSIINGVEPGNFLTMNQPNSNTRSLIFVQSLPGGYKPEKIVDDMVNIARTFVEIFGGTLLDEDQSVLTQQTIKYYKDKIRQFKLKSKLPQDREIDKKK